MIDETRDMNNENEAPTTAQECSADAPNTSSAAQGATIPPTGEAQSEVSAEAQGEASDTSSVTAEPSHLPPTGEAQSAQSASYSSYDEPTRSGEYAGAGVGRTERVGGTGYTTVGEKTDIGTGMGSAYAHRASTDPSPRYVMDDATAFAPAKKKKERKGIGAPALCLMLAGALLVGVMGGFGGAVLYNEINPASASGGNNIIVNKVESSEGATPEEGSLAEMIASVENTVVEIRTEAVVNGSFFGNYVSEGAGSGVIISSDGYIITNNHVISGADTITVTTKGGDEYAADLIATDAQTDVAVIKVEATELQAAVIGSSADLVVGERAVAIGNPLGELGGSVTIGFISALDRELTIDGSKMTLLQTDAAINPGNSGGALFNASGELIGIVNAKSSGDAIEGLGFAIPIDTAMSVASDLIESGHVSGRPALGIQVVEIATNEDYYKYRNSELGRYIDTYGVYIVEDSQGNFELGDRIVGINGTSVSSFTDISEILAEHQVGDTVTVTYARSRRMGEAEVTLVEMASTASTEE